MARNTPRGTPARVLLVFAMLMLVVAVSAHRSRQDSAGDRISWPSAVGDETFYRPGGEPVTLKAGRTLFLLREEGAGPVQERDDRMWRIPLTAATPRLYTPEEFPRGDVLPRLFVKTAHGEYLEMKLEPGPG